jgi:hypothetical protein
MMGLSRSIHQAKGSKLQKYLVILALAVGALMSEGSVAQAAPPVIVSATQVEGHATVTWTNPPGATNYSVIEIATATTEVPGSPGKRVVTSVQTGSDGAFFSEKVSGFAMSNPGDTTWTGTSALASGFYYVHVGGWDTAYASCPIREWSPVVPLTVPAPVLTTKVAASVQALCFSNSVRVSHTVTPWDLGATDGRTKVMLRGKANRTIVVKAGTSVYFKRLKPGKYTVSARYLGVRGSTADDTSTYQPSKVAVRCFALKTC